MTGCGSFFHNFFRFLVFLSPWVVLGSDSAIERLDYRLKWGLFTVGTVRLEGEDPRAAAEGDTVRYTLAARTNRWMDRFLKARTFIRSTYDPTRQRSLGYKRVESDGPVPEVHETLFDWGAGEVRYSKNGDRRVPLEIGDRAEDPLSIVHTVRYQGPAVGDVYSIPVTDGKAFTFAAIRVVDGGRVRTPAGRFDTLEVIADLGDVRGVFARPEGALIHVWITRDPPWTPVKLRSRIALGSFTAELTSVEFVPAMQP